MQFSLAITVQVVAFALSVAALPLDGAVDLERRTVEVDVQQNNYYPNQKRTVVVDVQQDNYYHNQKRTVEVDVQQNTYYPNQKRD